MPELMHATHPWRTTPRRTSIIFLLAVFCVFASFGFVSDMTGMGHQPPLRFAVTVVLSGLFAVVYASLGITMRSKFWKAFLPIFALQLVCMSLLARQFPDTPRKSQLDASESERLQGRLQFDGTATIVFVTLGYVGFVFVSVSEARRHIRSQAIKATLEGEMAAAREVQRVIVPEDLSQVRGYTVESAYRPASEVGGDFFQVIPLKSGRTLVVIGDVSGKGLRAAMIVSMIVGTLQSVSSYTEEPAEILRELNQRLFGRMHEGFVTCLAVRLGERGEIKLANAGHFPPCINGKELPYLGSLPLGLVENTVFEQSSFEMPVDGSIVLLTDGVAEARNSERTLFGFDRVESMLSKGATASNVAASAQQFGQDDDITVLRVTRQS